VCGAALQALVRNPLADPYLLGLSGGSSLGAVLAVVAGVGSAWAMPAAAFAGALLTIMVVYRLALVAGAGLDSRILPLAAAVAAAGIIGFVGLAVPHAIRMVRGPGHRGLLPSAFLLGGVFLVIADAAARTLFAPLELPVGVLTAMVGVPVFALLLRRTAV